MPSYLANIAIFRLTNEELYIFSLYNGIFPVLTTNSCFQKVVSAETQPATRNFRWKAGCLKFRDWHHVDYIDKEARISKFYDSDVGISELIVYLCKKGTSKL